MSGEEIVRDMQEEISILKSNLRTLEFQRLSEFEESTKERKDVEARNEGLKGEIAELKQQVSDLLGQLKQKEVVEPDARLQITLNVKCTKCNAVVQTNPDGHIRHDCNAG